MNYSIILNGQTEDQYIRLYCNIDEVNKLKEKSNLLEELFNTLENNESIELDISTIQILHISTKVALQYLLELLRPSQSKLVWDIEFAVLSSYFGVSSYVTKYNKIIRKCFGPPYNKIKDEDFLGVINITSNILEYALPHTLLTAISKYTTLKKQNKLTEEYVNIYITKDELVNIIVSYSDLIVFHNHNHSSIESEEHDEDEDDDDESADY